MELSFNTLVVVIGCMFIGAAAGLIGVFAFLRKQSLIGDALAHAALPGVCVAFLLTGTKDPFVILAGAVASCWLGALAVEGLTRYTRCKADSALGMVLSLFFAVGILLLTNIQKSGDAAQAGLDKFLFGQAAGLLQGDVYVFSGIAALLCIVVVVAHKELKAVTFDPDFAQVLGLPRRFTELLIATLIVLAVAIGLQAVGVVLMAALLVTPPAAARYWTERLGVMLALSAAFGAFSGVLGAWVSALSPRMPTGPWMVVAVTAVFVVSLVAAPRRGVAGRVWRHLRYRRKIANENVLRTLYRMGEDRHDWLGYYPLPDLLRYRNMSPLRMRRTLRRLERDGLVAEDHEGLYGLTDSGLAEGARLTRLHRLWEVYLTRKLEIAPDHVHDDAEEIEHVLTPELEAKLVAILNDPAEDPHDRTIPDVPHHPKVRTA